MRGGGGDGGGGLGGGVSGGCGGGLGGGGRGGGGEGGGGEGGGGEGAWMAMNVVFGAAGVDETAMPRKVPLEAVRAISWDTEAATESAIELSATGMKASTVIDAPLMERMISSALTWLPLAEAAVARLLLKLACAAESKSSRVWVRLTVTAT
eukprot:5710623-Prymnesium_polylepis.1